MIHEAPLFLRAATAFRRLPGVVGLGFGLKVTNGVRLDIHALRVIVRKKAPLSEVPKANRIPPFFENVPVDVCEPLLGVDAATPGNGLFLGANLDSRSGQLGSLGCFAKVLPAKTTTVLLTAGHVLSDKTGEFGAGGDVGSPDLSCCLCCVTGKVGDVLKGQIDENLDCGIATLTNARTPMQEIPGLGWDSNGKNTDRIVGLAPLKTEPVTGFQTPALSGDKLRKVGAATGWTRGVVNSGNYELPADPEANLSKMIHQIVIEPLQPSEAGGGSKLDPKRANHNVDFCKPGDSGAVVVNEANQIVGLLIRQADFSNQANVPSWMGFGGGATNIHNIVSAMGIEIYPSPQAPNATQPARALTAGMRVGRVPPLTESEQNLRAIVESAKGEMLQCSLGAELVQFIEQHEIEIRDLVNHNRHVTVVWHRSQGPAFLALLLKDIRDLDQPVPQSVHGVNVADCIASMREALVRFGSVELRDDIQRLWPRVQRALPSVTLRALIDNLKLGG